MTRSVVTFVGLLLLALQVWAPACRGSSDSSDEAGRAQETDVPAGTPTDAVVTTATSETGPELRAVHFKTEMQMETRLPDGSGGGFTGHFEGDIVLPDRIRLTGTFIIPGEQEEAPFDVIAIGDSAWKRVDTSDWVATDRSDFVVESALSLTPIEALQATAAELAYTVGPWPASPDIVEGVRTLRYDLPSELREEALAEGNSEVFERLLGGGEFAGAEGLEMSIWLGEDGRTLMRVHMAYSYRPDYLGNRLREDVPPGTEAFSSGTVTFTRHNDSRIVIEPPI